MPYFLDPTEEQNQQQNGSQVQISGAGPTTQPGAPAGGTQNKELNTGSGYQNLDKYLSTNQAQNFGNQVIGRVGTDIQNAQTSMANAGQSFKNQVNQSTSQMPTVDQINQAVSDPTHADATQYQKYINQTYQGPTSLSDPQSTAAWNQYWSGANQAQTNSQLLGTEPGRFTLLDSYFGKPTYNMGQKSLDNLLVQQSGLGSNIQNLQNQATQLQSQGKQGETQLQNYASNAASQVQNARDQARSAIGIDAAGNLTGTGALGTGYQTVENQVQAANDQRHAQLAQLQKDIARGVVSPAEYSQLGISGNPYAVDLSQYITPGQDLTRDQVMSPEQRAQLQALSQMAGVTDTFANGTQQAVSNPFNFDLNQYQQAAADAENKDANEQYFKDFQ